MSEAWITVGLRYADPTANADFATDYPDEPAPAPVLVQPHADTIGVDASAISAGEAVIADGTLDDHEVALNLGDVDEVRGFVIKNLSRQDLGVSINSGDVNFTIAHGATLSYATPAADETPITAISLLTTTTQSGAGVVAYSIFGTLAT